MPEIETMELYSSGEPLRLYCATEEALLEFANKLRKAGAADPLESLLPSYQGNSEACLIANALNFKSEIRPDLFARKSVNTQNIDGNQWAMLLPENMTEERIRHIAEQVECEVVRLEGARFEQAIYGLRGLAGRLVIALPWEIGNAASAFDYGWAFSDYNKALIGLMGTDE